MADPKKVANNILDFLIDPTKIPVQQRVYFRPEERLENGSYENAKADALIAYRSQKSNSDFYPNRNRKLIPREAMLMDRKSLIASFDILSKNFKENDSIGTDLRTMAVAVSKMSEEELAGRVASDAPDFEGMEVEAKAKTFPCPKCGTKVLEQTKYCVKCKAKVKPKSAAEEEVEEKKPVEEPETKEPAVEEKPVEKKEEEEIEASEVNDFWTKEATDLVAKALVSDVLGMSQDEEEDEEEATAAKKKAPKEEEVSAVKKEVEEEKKKAPKEEGVSAAKKEPVVPKIPEEKKEEEVEAKKVPEEKMPAMPEKEEKESTVVNTDILASITFGDINVPMGIVSSDDLKMSDEEKSNLAKLFN